MPLIIPSNSISAGGYEVDNSVRLNGDAYVHKAVSAGNQRTFTYSFWTKRSTLNNYDTFIGYARTAGGGGGTPRGELIFVGDGDDTLRVGFNPTASSWSNYTVSNRVFRDTSAWYHIVLKVNTTSGTETERLKIFVNGVSQSLSGYPSLNFDTGFNVNGSVYHIGRSASGTGNFIKGYLAEAVFIDGTALDADSFGEFDEDSGIWKPIDVSGLTFGNNGFYLPFENSAALGQDDSGNGNNFTVNNLTAIDSVSDVPTNNFATLNSLYNAYVDPIFSEGNLKITQTSGWCGAKATMGVSTGKWYWEIKLTGTMGNHMHGVQQENVNESAQNPMNLTGTTVFYNDDGGEMRTDGTQTTADYGTFSSGDIMGLALDMDAGSYGQITIYKNGSAIVSNFNLSSSSTTVMPFSAIASNGTTEYNFGNPPYTISSGNTDGNGYGNFEYAVPSGYLSLCTKNLSEVLG